eukprot:COSAG01_NODE_157_length_23722_cov_85.712568_21_plen_221_part_00
MYAGMQAASTAAAGGSTAAVGHRLHFGQQREAGADDGAAIEHEMNSTMLKALFLATIFSLICAAPFPAMGGRGIFNSNLKEKAEVEVVAGGRNRTNVSRTNMLEDCPGDSPPAPAGTYCAPLRGPCHGPRDPADWINNKYQLRGISAHRCAEYCLYHQHQTCVGYQHNSNYEECSLYGAGMAENAQAPWIPARTWQSTTIGGAGWDGPTATVCVAIAGRN